MSATDKISSWTLFREPTLYIVIASWLASCFGARWYGVSWVAAFSIANLLGALIFQVGTFLKMRAIRRLRREHR